MSRLLRILLRVILALLVIALVAVIGGYVYARPLLRTGTGYAAHNACAVQFISGRTAPETDLPDNPLVPYLRTYSDFARKDSETAIMGVLSKQYAWYTKGFGCTVGEQAPALGEPTAVTAAGNPFSEPAAPTMNTTAYKAPVATAMKAPGTRAIVVIKNGQLVAESYAEGFTASTPQLGWSMAKSVTNLLLGRRVLAGSIKITDDHLRPEWTDDRAKITIDDLSRMQSGLTWYEEYYLGTPITEMLYSQPDMAAFAAGQPLAHQPGSYQQYSSGSTNILCDQLTAGSENPADLPRKEIFAPLGLSSAVWEPDGAGNPVCSSYLWATPRDWAAIGQFALQDGTWNGQRLIPEGWMKQATTALPVEKSEEQGYAAGWWVNRQANGTLVDPALPADAYWASGHDGQRVYVVPSADLVVVRLGFSPGVSADALGTAPLVAALAALR